MRLRIHHAAGYTCVPVAAGWKRHIRNPQRAFTIRRIEVILPAETEVQSQVGFDLPIVLDKSGDRSGANQTEQAADTLAGARVKAILRRRKRFVIGEVEHALEGVDRAVEDAG